MRSRLLLGFVLLLSGLRFPVSEIAAQSRTVLNNPAVQTDINLAGHGLTNVGSTGGLAVTVDANGLVTNVANTNYPTGHLLINGVAVDTSIAAKANDGAVVHNTGAENVAGVKTFSSAPIVPSNSFPESAVTSLVTDLAGKEPTITGGTSLQYWRGDKTFQTLNTAAVPESGSLYFTNSRAIAAPLTGYVSGAGTITSADSILVGIQKNAGNIAAIVTPSNTTATTNNFFTAYNSSTGAFTKARPAIADLSDAGQLATWAGITPSANAQTLLGHTFSQMRTDLSLVVGTNVEAWDADLDTWATITPATGVGTFLATPTLVNLKAAVADETTVGWNLLTLTNPGAITFLKVAADNSVSTETASTHRTSIGATTVGGNLFTLTNPSAVTFLQVNADNTVTAQSASSQRTALGLAIGTNVQAWDADLDTYAANTPSATGLNLVKLANPGAISFIKIAADNSVSTESASAHRTSLGLAIGTNVEAWDADLDTWATITPATGIGTFLATPSSANLAAAVTNETGSGALAFATSPTFVTPTLGAATATSINGNTFTTGTYTLTGTAAKTLTFNNTLTLAGTDSTTMTFPSTSATIARTDAANTFTGHQTIEGVTSTGATGTGKFVFDTSPTLVSPVLGAATATSLAASGTVTGSNVKAAAVWARAYNSANISLTSGSATALTFDSERADTDTIHSTSSNTGRLTCNTAGVYQISGSATFGPSSTGMRQLYIRLNGTTVLSNFVVPAAVVSTAIETRTIYALAATDYVELVANQDSGGALNVITGANYSPEFMMVWMGP